MTTRALTAPLAALALTLALVSGADAGAPADRLREFFASVNAALVDPATDERPLERLEAVRRLVRDLIDYRSAAGRALGGEWRRRTPSEQEEFAALFADFVENAYVTGVASRARLDGGATVTIVDETVDSGSALVRTLVPARSGPDLSLDYRMVWRRDRWMVADVVVDGVSIVDNYRAQMRRIVDRSSYGDLVAEMRARLGRPPAPEPRVVVAGGQPATHDARPPARMIAAAAPVAGAPPVAPQPVAPTVSPHAPAAGRPAPTQVPPAPAAEPSVPARVVAAPAQAIVTVSGAPAAIPPSSPMPGPGLADPPPYGIAPDVIVPDAGPSLPRVTVAPATRPASAPPVKHAAGSQPTASAVAASGAARSAPAPLAATPNGSPAVVAAVRPQAGPPAPTVAAPGASASPAQPAETPSRVGARRFWIQVGAFKSPEAATRLATRLGARPIAVTAGPTSRALLRVLVGPFPARAEAAVALHDLKALGFRAFIAEERD